MRVYVDIETRSRIDLRRTGVYRYVTCPDFRILMAGWSIDGKAVTMTLGQDDTLKMYHRLAGPSTTFVAHNATFERIAFSSALGNGYLPPEDWHDTQAVAAERGYPQSLDKLAKALGTEEKDSAGTRLINLFSKPNRKGEWNGPETHPMEWLDFIFYCEQDVATLVAIDRLLGDHVNETERQVYLADQRVNDVGLLIDEPMAHKAAKAADFNHHMQKARVTELTGVENPGSVSQLLAWVQEQGLEARNLRVETVEHLLAGDLTDTQREVLELRQELALTASAKYSTAVASVLPDSRLRGSFKFYGAHTGRWSGRGAQPQNLPRLAFENEVDTELAIGELMADERVSAPDLKRLVRPMFMGPFTVVDYSAIEARVVAWLASETWALDAFAAGRDIYVETAERMSTPSRPLTRFQGKIAVLALGYNGAVNSLRGMGAEGTDEELANQVRQWRRANQRIVNFWQRMYNAFGDGGAVGAHISITHSRDKLGQAAHMHLPSGRAITYHGIRWGRYKVKDPVTERLVSKEGWRYANPAGYLAGTYGGRLTENATQAVARDILAEAIVRLQDRRYTVVGHVHDEIIIEGEHDVEEIRKIVCEPPGWAGGLPIDGEGFTCDRYRKG